MPILFGFGMRDQIMPIPDNTRKLVDFYKHEKKGVKLCLFITTLHGLNYAAGPGAASERS